MIHISVQTEDFSTCVLHELLAQNNSQDGAIVEFTGRVRDMNMGNTVTTLTLEHYPGMTEKYLGNIAQEAQENWALNNIVIVHRVGSLTVMDNIVFVGVSSAHRQDAFAGCAWIMDELKTTAPFWKYESTDKGAQWLKPAN